MTYYGHMTSGSVTTKSLGSNISCSEQIGGVGTSGNSSGLHLHFEPRLNWVGFDPYAGSCSVSTSWWVDQGTGSPSTICENTSPKFNIGDTVEVFGTNGSGLKAWTDICSGTYIVKPDGAIGTILQGPQSCDGYNRWKIRWADDLSERWSAEDWLRETSETISTPSTPSGPTSGAVGTSYTYSTGGATSSLGHSVEYRFNWGDGTYSSWSSSATASKSWSSSGTYVVKAQARCATHTDKVSSESSGLSVTVTVAQITVTSFQINNGAVKTRSYTVTLNNTAIGSPTHYMASEYQNFGDASWQEYSAAPYFTLRSGPPKTRTVYFKVKNSSGESSVVVQDSIKIKYH